MNRRYFESLNKFDFLIETFANEFVFYHDIELTEIIAKYFISSFIYYRGAK